MPIKGKTVAEVTRNSGITETTWYRWKNHYGGMKANDEKRLKELKTENRKLKTIIVDLTSTRQCQRSSRSETGNPESQAQSGEVTTSAVRGFKAQSLQGHGPTKIYSKADLKVKAAIIEELTDGVLKEVRFRPSSPGLQEGLSSRLGRTI